MNERKNTVPSDMIEIDVLRLIKALWQRAVIIILVAAIGGGVGFSYAKFFIAPRYEAQVLMYVNNKNLAVTNPSSYVSSADLAAAQSLVGTYIVVLNSRNTLEKVAQKVGPDYTYEQIKGMVSASALSKTEAFRITVNSTDPQEAAKIANTIADVLPDAISNVVEGSSVRVVDHAAVPTNKSSPSLTKYAATGLMIGFLVCCALIVLREIFDDVIHDENDLTQKYDLPILAMIPDLAAENSDSYHYYRRKYGGSKEKKEAASSGKQEQQKNETAVSK